MEEEVTDVERWISEIKTSTGQAPKLAYILVNKRINERFATYDTDYYNKSKKLSNANNPPSGTLVADKVVSKFFDF